MNLSESLSKQNLLKFVLLGLFMSTLAIQLDAENELTLTGEKVVVFKNGYCLIVKRAKGTTDAEGNISTFEVPDSAILGSFWAVPTESKLLGMTAGLVEEEINSEEETTCTQTIELLQANKGSQCSIVMDDGTVLSGQIGKALVNESMQASSANDHLNIRPIYQATGSGYHRTVQRYVPAEYTQIHRSQITGDKFLLETEDGDVLLNASQVQRLVVKDMKTVYQRNTLEKKTRKRLEFKFDRKDSEVDFLIMYFRPGVRWIPTYRLDLAQGDGDSADGKQTARLDLQGEIINEAEDIIDTPIDLVVGVPNFRFENIPSPLSLEKVLRNALLEAAPELMGQSSMMSNALFTQRSGEVGRGASQGAMSAEAEIELEQKMNSEGGNDLFIYHLDKMTLRKGERASLPILTASVPYKDVYTWQIQTQRTNSAPNSSSPLKLSQKNVWRQIQFDNNSEVPLTTGACMLVDGFQPLGQELLTYTPRGGTCRVPVTVAVDLVGQLEDYETDRKPNPESTWKWDRIIVSNKIDLELVNYKDRAITVEIELLFGGRVDEVSDDGTHKSSNYRSEDWQSYYGESAANSSSKVVWKTTIEAGETFSPSVSFHYYSTN